MNNLLILKIKRKNPILFSNYFYILKTFFQARLDTKHCLQVLLLCFLFFFGLSYLPAMAGIPREKGSKRENLAAPGNYRSTTHRKREHRKVYILVEIYPDGRVKSATLYKSSGYPELDETALFSAKQWKFSPRRDNDKTIRKKILCVRFSPSLNPRSRTNPHSPSSKSLVSFVLAHVSPTGHVINVRLYKSSGDPELDHMALNAVKRWRLHPARQGNTPVESQVIIPVRFHLRHYQQKQPSISAQNQ